MPVTCSLLLLSAHLMVTLSINNCKYFGTETGPLIPINVCMQWNTESNTGSYAYQCDGFDEVHLHWFPESDCCRGFDIRYNAISPIVQNCGGGICNHVTVREYQRYQKRENMCYKNESQSFIEYAFVTDCWDSIILPEQSWSLDCTSDTLSMRLYDKTGCNGNVRNISEITEGCKWRNDMDLNISFPIFNISKPNITRNGNDTYLEIKMCGGATNPWLIILIGTLIAITCIACCCFCVCCYFCQKRKKSKQQKRNIDPLIVNQDHEGDYTTK